MSYKPQNAQTNFDTHPLYIGQYQSKKKKPLTPEDIAISGELLKGKKTVGSLCPSISLQVIKILVNNGILTIDSLKVTPRRKLVMLLTQNNIQTLEEILRVQNQKFEGFPD